MPCRHWNSYWPGVEVVAGDRPWIAASVCALWVANCGIDRVGGGQQLARAGEVGHVGVGLAREDRVAVQAVELRALDLAVPVGALDQAHHQPVAAAPRQVDDEVDHRRAALLVGLDHEAEPVPAGQRRLEAPGARAGRARARAGRPPRRRCSGRCRSCAPAAPARSSRGYSSAITRSTLGAHVARVQRRQLDRDARARR